MKDKHAVIRRTKPHWNTDVRVMLHGNKFTLRQGGNQITLTPGQADRLFAQIQKMKGE